MTFIHFNAYATPIQIKRYSIKDLEVQEQLLIDDFDVTSEIDATIRPEDSISQQGNKQGVEQIITPVINKHTITPSIKSDPLPTVVIEPKSTNVLTTTIQPIGTNISIVKTKPTATTITTTTPPTTAAASKPMPLLNLLAKAKIPLERTESEESGTSNSSVAKSVVVENAPNYNNMTDNITLPINPMLAQIPSHIPSSTSLTQPVSTDVSIQSKTTTQPTIVQSTIVQSKTTSQHAIIPSPRKSLQSIQTSQPTTLITAPTVPILPLPDRLVSTSSRVGSDISVVSQNQPIFAIDQHHWNDLVNRLHNQECEQEKLKGQVKRLMLMLQTTQQSAKRDAADLRTELHSEMEAGAKKVKNEIVEYTQIREFEYKHYSDKRLKDEMSDVKFQIDTLSQQLGSLHNMTTTVYATKSKPNQEKSSLIMGIIVGLFMLYNLAQWMSYLLKNPALQYYSTNNLKPFYPS